MNAKVKALWLTALRSGKYKQGEGMLHQVTESRGDLFCCLGVLCEVAIEKKALPPGKHRPSSIAVHYGQEGDAALLPREVQEWAELDDGEGRYDDDRALANDNDNGESFEDIAKTIEENF